jgi:hypothetical protein
MKISSSVPGLLYARGRTDEHIGKVKQMGAFLQIFIHNMSINFECKKLQASLFDEGAVVDWRYIGKTIKIIASTCINDPHDTAR